MINEKQTEEEKQDGRRPEELSTMVVTNWAHLCSASVSGLKREVITGDREANSSTASF